MVEVSKPKYLVFDFDGVLGNTREASAQSTAVVEGVDLNTARENNHRYASNKPNHTRDHTLTDADLARIYKWTTDFGNLMKESGFGLFDDFVQEVESIETKFKAVVSSGSQLYVIPALAKTTINPTHILAYENHHSKEEKIETIARDWGADIADIFYFTDTLADVYELQNMISKDKLIGVAWGYCGYDALATELEEQYILKKAQDIHRVI